ncbi:MAG: ATP-binding protein [Methanosphaera stadtmanae]|nr:ATP-binding protein [Methanosphaera stadtmanae]
MSNLPWINKEVLFENEFYNRKEEIMSIETLLQMTAMSNAPKILLTGVRCVGKTVLLNKIKLDLNDDYLVIYSDFSSADCYQKNNMTPEGILTHLYKDTIKECKNKKINLATKRIKKFFKTNDFNIEQIVNIDKIPVPIIKSNVNFNNLKEFVLELPQIVYEENTDKIKGVIILIDEFQIIKELGNYKESFLWVIRSYIQKQNNVAYVFTGSMGLEDELIYDISGKNGVFGGRLLTIHIPKFSKELTKKYLEERAEDLLLTEKAFDRFYKCTSGIPAYINMFGILLPKNVLLDEEEIVEKFDENLPTILTHLINLWNRLSKKEKDIIISLLNKPLKRIEIANKLEVTSGSLSLSLNKLQNLALIEFKENKYHLSERLLGRWLIKEFEKKGSYPYIVY